MSMAGVGARNGARQGALWGGIAGWLTVWYGKTLAACGVRDPAAWWQAGVCLAAAPVLLLVVLKVLGSPKRFLHGLPRVAVAAAGVVTGLAQFVVPWLGWSALVYVMNVGALAWPAAVRAGGGVAAISYLTGLGLVLIFQPKAKDVVVAEVDIPLPGLPVSFDGYRILHISDLHVSWWHSPAQASARLAGAREGECDLVVFTGDLADEGGERVERAADLLGSLRPRDGVVAVLGNHDIWVGESLVSQALAERGVRVLVNQHALIERNGDKLYIAGVGDASYSRRDDLSRALEGIPEDGFVVLLSHTPDIIAKPGAEKAALVLAGHTHGGQIVLPWIGPFFLPAKVGRHRASGLHRIGDGWLFVTRGLGEVFPPLRIACPPEIALLTLRSAP